MKRILFVCVENAGRSQMAEAFANHYGSGRIVAKSGGTKPAERVNPIVVQAMLEKGIDISGKRPKPLEPRDLEEADMVVTMGCGAEEFCPATFLEKVTDWGIEDPKGKTIEEVRKIRDEIERRVKALIEPLAISP
jgi:protein-tyrosine-phosphatase